MRTKFAIVLILLFLNRSLLLSRFNPRFHKRVSKKQLVGFVKEAKAFIRIYGISMAVSEFQNKKGLFFRGSLFIYAFDYKGKVLAHGRYPNMRNLNLYQKVDFRGHFYIQEQIKMVEFQKKGFIEYKVMNFKVNRVETRLAYVEKVNKKIWIGASILIKK